MTRAWNYHSEVAFCPTCEGTGKTHAYRRPTVSDPYPEQPCDCGLGEHTPECSVCGFDQMVRGYDCYACQTVAGLAPDELEDFDPDSFAAAVKVAAQKALAEVRSEAA